MKKKVKRLFKVKVKSALDKKAAKVLQSILDQNEKTLFNVWMDQVIYGQGFAILNEEGKFEHVPYDKAYPVSKGKKASVKSSKRLKNK
jgi:hypothetical protein